MPPTTIRAAQERDLAAVMAIEEASFATGVRETLPTYRARLALHPHGFRVAVHDGVLVGFITSEWWRAEEGLSAERFAIDHHPARHHRADGDLLYLSAMAVAPEARGLGVGAALLASLLDESKTPVRAALLLVARGWTAARALYARSGFRECAVLPGFFRAQDRAADDGLVLRLEIADRHK